MSPTRWVLPRALSLSWLAVALGAATASAQFYDPALQSLGLATGPVSRSPRLLGLGGLSLVVPDRDASINLWDFAGLPVGLSSDDTTSTLDLRPGTDALSSVRTLPDGRQRQNLAARATAAQMEAVYRNRQTGGVFGLVGDMSSLRWDRPYAAEVEVRQGLTHPQIMPILGGVFPRWFSGHLAWAAHLRFRSERAKNQYREIVMNSAGEYIGLGGGELPVPGVFVPIDTDVLTTAYGLSGAYTVARRTKFAVGIEHESNEITVLNDLPISVWETRERRPQWIGRAALVSALGQTFECGVTGTGRLSKSEADWRFSSVFLAGGRALEGRGNMLTREEQGSELSARARWTPGRATLAGSFFTAADKITVDPPNASDVTSLNRFINRASGVPDAIVALDFPDSIVHRESRRYAYGWGGGGSYRFGRTTLGSEFTWSRDIRSTTLLGSGPRRIAWVVRAGLERPLGAHLAGRLGYVYRSVDEDDFTAGNEYTGNAVSAGLGYAPAGAAWSLETGYMMEFRNQDFSDPGDERQSRQNLAVQLHWTL